MAAVIGFAGFSNSGKTTLISKLIPQLRSSGKTVAVIKHDGHDHYKEAENKDTSRYLEAGADGFAVISPESYVMMERKRVSLLSILKTLGHYDFVFVEGFKSEPHEKIAVFRERKQAAVLKQLTAPPIAIASAFPYESEHIPVFDINDSAGLAAWIVARTQRLP